jgi:hypothetical protein
VAPAIKVPTLQVQTPVLPEKRNQPCECWSSQLTGEKTD